MKALALYGRTYLDAEVEVPIDQLGSGKGKVDVEVRPVLGGFPCNAARALAGRLRGEDMSIATRISKLDVPRLYAALPSGTAVEAVVDDSLDWPTIAVIINPARECRLLRSGEPGDLRGADLGTIPSATLHVFGRVAPVLVADVRRAQPAAVLAWVAGASADPSVIADCDLACVNTAEAIALLGDGPGDASARAQTTRELATALAAAGRPGCVRVVTGRGEAPAVAAVRVGAAIQCFESAPAPVERAQIRRLKGVGDVFAARFMVEAVLDESGRRRTVFAVESALAAARGAAAAFMTAPVAT